MMERWKHGEMRRPRPWSGFEYRAGAALASVSALLMLWYGLRMRLADGADNPAHLMFCGVLLVGVASVLIARFRPRGMMRSMFAAAGTQAVVALLSLFERQGRGAAVLSVFFVLLWCVAAQLFRRAIAAPSQRD